MTKKQCRKCKKGMSDFDYQYGRKVCESCSEKKRLTVSIIVGLLFLIPIFALANTDFNYRIDKCKSLTPSSSSYDFTERIEISGQ